MLRDIGLANEYGQSELQRMKKSVFRYVKLTNQLSFKTYFQNVAQHTGSKRLIHSTNASGIISLELP